MLYNLHKMKKRTNVVLRVFVSSVLISFVITIFRLTNFQLPKFSMEKPVTEYKDVFNEFTIITPSNSPTFVYTDITKKIENCVDENRLHALHKSPSLKITNTKTNETKKYLISSSKLNSKAWIFSRSPTLSGNFMITFEYLNKFCLSESQIGYLIIDKTGNMHSLQIPTLSYTEELYIKNVALNKDIFKIPTYSSDITFIQSNFNRDTKSEEFLVLEPLKNTHWRVVVFEIDSNKLASWWNDGKPLETEEDMSKITSTYDGTDYTREFLKKYTTGQFN